MRLLTFIYHKKEELKQTDVPICIFTESPYTYLELKEKYPILKQAEPIKEYVIDSLPTEVPTDRLLTVKSTQAMHDLMVSVGDQLRALSEEIGEKEQLLKNIRFLGREVDRLEEENMKLKANQQIRTAQGVQPGTIPPPPVQGGAPPTGTPPPVQHALPKPPPPTPNLHDVPLTDPDFQGDKVIEPWPTVTTPPVRR